MPRAAPGGAWSADSAYFFYLVHDELWRQHQVWRHRLGTPASADELVLEEPDGQFELEVEASRTGDLVVIWSENRDTSEVWVVDAADPTSAPRSVGGRRRGVEYHAEHVRHPDGSDELLLVTNDGAHRVPAGALPGAALGRPGLHGLGARCDPRTRPSGSSRWTPSPGTWC